jgi:hypothetical protein
VSAKKNVPAKGGGNNGELEMLKCAQNTNEVKFGRMEGGRALPFADFLPSNVYQTKKTFHPIRKKLVLWKTDEFFLKI